jgi:hypothetical protein
VIMRNFIVCTPSNIIRMNKSGRLSWPGGGVLLRMAEIKKACIIFGWKI